jgi:hypothetical protein
MVSFVITTAVGVLAVAELVAAAGPRPLFQLPFPCGVNTLRVVG